MVLASTKKPEQVMNPSIHGVSIPDSKIAREITELVRETESPLLFHHSRASITSALLLANTAA